MYDVTLWSIERQFRETIHINPTEEFGTNEEFEPGMAQFSKVFKDLLVNKKRFLNRGSVLTTGLVLSSVLKAANVEYLRIKKWGYCDQTEFCIVKIKRD